MAKCYMIREQVGGGGNTLTNGTIMVRRSLALGDVCASLCVVDKLQEQGYKVSFQAHSAAHCILRRHGGFAGITEPNGFCHVNLDGAYEDNPQRTSRHFSDMFMEVANRHLSRFSISLGEPFNCRPQLKVPPHVQEAARNKFKQYDRPWVFVCPRSQNFFARTVGDDVWARAASKMNGTKFWLGMHPAPSNFVDLKCQHVDNLIDWLSVADLLVSVDSGPLHLGAALGVPCVALGQSSSPELHLSDQRDYVVIWPEGLDCLNCQKNACPKNYYTPPCQNFDPEVIATTANKRLESIFGDKVSAVIAIYKPDPNTLNRCLECIIPQVDEVIVTSQYNSLLPATALKHDKVKYVRRTLAGTGYSINCNYGCRHSNGRYLAILNDDVFVEPGSIARLKECMKPGVGIVSGMLFYPDGTIYHAGKVRDPGVRGWGHADYKQRNHSFRDVTELENVNGAFIMADRKAFYDAQCQDEEFPVFTNDDALCLSVRKNGYKVLFTPHARGTHLEHQSIGKLSDSITSLLNQSNKTFDRKWGAYLTHNAYKIPGDFSYCR